VIINKPDFIYVGSTKHFTNRKYHHKNSCNNEKSHNHNCKLYITIRENGGFNNVEMIPIEEMICENKIQVLIRERYWFDTLQAKMNTYKPYVSYEERLNDMKAYYDTHKEEIAEQCKIYREENHEVILEKKKIYYNANKEADNMRSKNYRDTHKEEMKAYKEQWHETNKAKIHAKNNEVIKCECGCEYTRANKARHLKTQRHLLALKVE
jgi:hypothetical protein